MIIREKFYQEMRSLETQFIIMKLRKQKENTFYRDMKILQQVREIRERGKQAG